MTIYVSYLCLTNYNLIFQKLICLKHDIKSTETGKDYHNVDKTSKYIIK